jgi:hypothetical protein
VADRRERCAQLRPPPVAAGLLIGGAAYPLCRRLANTLSPPRNGIACRPRIDQDQHQGNAVTLSERWLPQGLGPVATSPYTEQDRRGARATPTPDQKRQSRRTGVQQP